MNGVHRGGVLFVCMGLLVTTVGVDAQDNDTVEVDDVPIEDDAPGPDGTVSVLIGFGLTGAAIVFALRRR